MDELTTPRRFETLADRHRWFPLGMLAVLAFSALAVAERPPAVTGGKPDLGDTAWLLTATGLVLLMTWNSSRCCGSTAIQTSEARPTHVRSW